MADLKNKPDANTKAAKAKGGAKKAKTKGSKKKSEKQVSLPKGYQPRLRTVYKEKVAPELKKQFNIKNPMLIPRLDKIVLNVGMGTLHSDAKMAESLVNELRLMTGQQPVLTRARLSISNFKLRQGMIVGCRVTLRGFRMWEFMDRLISIVIPRIRDFRGMTDRSFDGRGNYTFGIKEQIIFPEIDYDKVVKIHGMDITICTSASADEEGRAILKLLGFPFRERSTESEAA
jgi:large subunit ribosomal protein L5